MAMGMVWGRRLSPRNIGLLVNDMIATIAEFGEPGEEAQEVLGGPLGSPEDRLDWANRGVNRTARRLAAKSPFYARRFAAVEADPAKLDVEGLRAIPVTTKQDLIEQCRRFPLQRRGGLPGHPHHRHHRPPG